MSNRTRLYVRVMGGAIVLFAALVVVALALPKDDSDTVTVALSPIPTATATQKPTTENTENTMPESAATPTLLEAMLYFADDDPYYGPEDAPVMIIEFSDYLCPWCGKFYFDTLPQILEAYPDEVRYIHRDYPVLGMFDADAPMRAAVAAGCALAQDHFWEMHSALFEPYRDMDMSTHGRPQGGNEGGGMPDPSERGNMAKPYTAENLRKSAESIGLDMAKYDACVAAQTPAAEVQHDLSDGSQLSISSVPTYIINGMIVQGAQSFEVFSQIIDQVLAERPLY
jgi:protein-disulfide isomerase